MKPIHNLTPYILQTNLLFIFHLHFSLPSGFSRLGYSRGNVFEFGMF